MERGALYIHGGVLRVRRLEAVEPPAAEGGAVQGGFGGGGGLRGSESLIRVAVRACDMPAAVLGGFQAAPAVRQSGYDPYT